MATNANVFNSRVTSEALEAKFRQVFPAQAGAELIQDLYASGVIQPVIDFSSVAEGSVLAENLQTAWDFSTGSSSVSNTSTTIITNTGFWLIDFTFTSFAKGSPAQQYTIDITDGSTSKAIWSFEQVSGTLADPVIALEDKFVVFLRAGDACNVVSADINGVFNVWYRQIADVNGNLVNPLGFTFQ